MSLESLRTPQPQKTEKTKMTALQMARHIFKISAAAGHPYRNISPEQWAKKWLASPVFVLTDVETDRVALIRTPRNVNKVLSDMSASASKQEPVVVDLNKNKLSAKNGYVPSVVAVDGAHRCYGEYLKGRDLMKAWVGSKALDRVRPEPLFAASEVKMGAAGVGTKISTAASLYEVHAGGPGSGRHKEGDSVQVKHPALGTYKWRSGQPDWHHPAQVIGVNRSGYHVRITDGPNKGSEHIVGDTNIRAAQSSTTKPYPASVERTTSPGGANFTRMGGVYAGVKGHPVNCDCKACNDMRAMEADGMSPNPNLAAGGPGASMGEGSGPTPKFEAKKVKAGTPAARSSGQLEEPDPSDENVPVDPSDSGQSVSPSDQLQYEEEPQHNPPGVKGWSSEVRGKNNPVSEAPGSGVGPRLTPDKGASNSELRRTVKASKKCSDCPSMFASKHHIKRIVTGFKAAVAKGYVPKMKAKTPPGCEDAVQGLKKSGVDNPWAVAWWMKDKGRC